MLGGALPLLLLAGVRASNADAPSPNCAAKLYPGSCFACKDASAGCSNAGSVAAASVADCCSACAANKHCDLFTLQAGTGECYMKASSNPTAPPTACTNGTSGRLPPRPPPPPGPPPPAPTPLPAGKPRSSFKNVLFIAVDDLRPEIGAYGHKFMHTPHLDKFANESTVFTRA